jgi:threonine synthase
VNQILRPVFTSGAVSVLRCVHCGLSHSVDEVRYVCTCGSQLEVVHPAMESRLPEVFEKRVSQSGPAGESGVWRYKEGILPFFKGELMTHPEGNTRLYQRDSWCAFARVDDLALKHEGENPTGSFKDRGMTVAITQAKALGKAVVGCASTGNTSAALAAYAARAGMKALVFLPQGYVAAGKLAQALSYGAICVRIAGDFDGAMRWVVQAAEELGIYLVNSLNPFRPEGQKTIMWEMLQQRKWSVPDWVVVPGGNLGNTSAFGKALREAHAAGWIDRLPRIAVIQARGASPFSQSFENGFRELVPVKADTIATAIRIGNPVNFQKARFEVASLQGFVTAVSDEEIMDAKSVIDRSGVGCEPASACSLAGVRKLRQMGVIAATDSVVGILTGHLLKDAETALSVAHTRGGGVCSLDISDSLEPLRQLLNEADTRSCSLGGQ